MLSSLLASTIGQDLAATSPVDRLGEEWWKARHEQCLAISHQGKAEVLFIGDSITQGWEGAGKAAWDEHFAPLNSANFGFSGDRTEHVLWRLQKGETLGLNPKLVVLMIGTNNIGHGSSNSEQTAQGVTAVVALLRQMHPDANILLLGIFPRGETASDPMRTKVADATKMFAELHDGEHVYFRDIGYAFVRSNGNLRTLLMPDRLHLNQAGYQIWAEAIAEDVKKLTANEYGMGQIIADLAPIASGTAHQNHINLALTCPLLSIHQTRMTL